jgi:single-strand DNA-binding protein
MNKLFLIGNLTKDPETRATPNGKTVCNFDIAVNDRQGNPTYFRISAWEKQGENCQRYLSKGKKVSVVGPVSARAYTDRNGKANVSIEVTANEVEFLSPANNAATTAPVPYPPSDPMPVEVEDIPF